VTAAASVWRRSARFGALVLVAVAFLLGTSAPSAASAQPSGPWIFVRGGEAPVAAERLVEVLAVGDVMTGRGLAGTPDVFAHVSEALRGADLTLGNLEGVIAPAGASDTATELLMPLGTERSLAQAGFDLIGLANNHILDAGPAGLAETRRLLRDAGLDPVDGVVPVVREVGGLKLAFLAWNDVGAPDPGPLLAAVGQARIHADAVLVMLHWGKEYTRHPNLPQRDLANRLLEAGADVVIGAHPHVVQDLRLVQPSAPGDRARLVAYSLGNFAFDQGWDDTAQGLALRLLFDRQGLRAAQALPLWTAPRPRWMDAESASPLIARVLPPERIGYICSAETCQPAPVPDVEASGIFQSGSIDLTGDGLPETVRLEAGSAEIVQGGRSVWKSPQGWHVRDLALGDPNGDGRYELLLAVDREGGASQPFVIGYRGGMYRQLWGGSPVSDPILEVELADVDGDGLQELAAVESAAGGARSDVSVWRWHGWGFSLIWRSPPGDYNDLMVLPPTEGQPARLSVAAR
jgi:poly-gamma-glutamate synthesis protein (capsule biosynthesis protein)